MARFSGVVTVFLYLFVSFRVIAAITTAPATQPTVVAEYPIADYKHPILIPVQWESKPAFFILDTGSAGSALDPAFFPGLTDLHKKAHIVTPDGDEEFEIFQPPNLKVGPVSLEDSNWVITEDLSDFRARSGKPIIGILGAQALRDWVVQIDFDARRLRFIQPDHEVHPEWGHVVGMSLDGGVPGYLYHVGSDTGEIVLDTGCAFALAEPADYFETVRAAVDVNEVVAGYHTLTGTGFCECMIYPRFEPFQNNYENVLMSACKNGAWLGRPFLSRNLITFSFPDYLIYMKPGRDFQRPDQLETHELVLTWNGREVLVKGLDPFGLLHDAGLREHDIVESVDGKKVTDWDLLDLEEFLNTQPKLAVEVSIRRGEQLKTITIPAKEENPATEPTTQDSGISWLQSLSDNAWLELSTLPASSSERFCFEVTMDTGNTEFAKQLPSCKMLVARDKDRVAVLVRTLTDECCAYATNGLVLAIDHANPGHVFRMRHCNPLFVNQMLFDSPGLLIRCGFHSDDHPPKVMLELNDEIGHMIKRGKSAAWDGDSRSYTMTTAKEKAQFWIDEADTDYLLKKLAIHVTNGPSMTYSIIDRKSVPADYRSLLNDPSAILNRFSQSNAIFEDIDPKDLNAEAAAKLFASPDEPAKDPRQKRLFSDFKSALLPQAATTNPK
jgi:hypothetical protein